MRHSPDPSWLEPAFGSLIFGLTFGWTFSTHRSMKIVSGQLQEILLPGGSELLLWVQSQQSLVGVSVLICEVVDLAMEPIKNTLGAGGHRG